jgi:hypothetical protein
LLDEAIREHLELKRRRGADPAEVAREQHEALDPVTDRVSSTGLDPSTEEHALEDEPALEQGELPAQPAPAALAEAAEHPLHGPLRGDGADVPASEHTALLEETAELDMNTVLDEQSVGATRVEGPPPQPQQAQGEAHDPPASEEEQLGIEPGVPGSER